MFNKGDHVQLIPVERIVASARFGPILPKAYDLLPPGTTGSFMGEHFVPYGLSSEKRAYVSWKGFTGGNGVNHSVVTVPIEYLELVPVAAQPKVFKVMFVLRKRRVDETGVSFRIIDFDTKDEATMAIAAVDKASACIEAIPLNFAKE